MWSCPPQANSRNGDDMAISFCLHRKQALYRKRYRKCESVFSLMLLSSVLTNAVWPPTVQSL
ncbi:hypothetical protein CO2235_U590115 [Cupriavidus oxalaticus]|uniref:Uncharacterized protein n=1 Tax=Cupriavidus oxalaticus TaxID=96344 RepID=A0A375FJA8_9BURK|nr:hypothetical protein CO2235_U590115 [Cupriavidus oxalaticus]